MVDRQQSADRTLSGKRRQSASLRRPPNPLSRLNKRSDKRCSGARPCDCDSSLFRLFRIQRVRWGLRGRGPQPM